MIKFEKVSRFADIDLPLPERKTAYSAGYDMVVAEDIIIPTWARQHDTLCRSTPVPLEEICTLEEMAALTKSTKAKPTLVSTGMKCKLEPGYYLELSVRSSTPLKYWIILANGIGIIDGDYYNNPDNEGEIFFQVINLSPYPIALKRGDIIGQGIIKKYEITSEDNCRGDKRIGGFGSTNASQFTAENAIDYAKDVNLDTIMLEKFGTNTENVLDALHKELYKKLMGNAT